MTEDLIKIRTHNKVNLFLEDPVDAEEGVYQIRAEIDTNTSKAFLLSEHEWSELIRVLAERGARVCGLSPAEYLGGFVVAHFIETGVMDEKDMPSKGKAKKEKA